LALNRRLPIFAQELSKEGKTLRMACGRLVCDLAGVRVYDPQQLRMTLHILIGLWRFENPGVLRLTEPRS
jgi:hypothetical protein